MTRSQWQANENMKATKPTKSDEARQKAAMEAHDRAVRRYQLKERLCKWAVMAFWLGVGLFMAYVLYKKGA